MYQYKVKIFNPLRRKKAITRNIHDFKEKFDTVSQLKSHIVNELQDELSEDPIVDVGYFETRQSLKVWVVTPV